MSLVYVGLGASISSAAGNSNNYKGFASFYKVKKALKSRLDKFLGAKYMNFAPFII